MSEYELKNERFPDDGPKRRKRRKAKPCPHCGNPLKLNKRGKFLFCRTCHARMPWTAAGDYDKPVKEEVADGDI